jgi:hypothetical protein
MSNLSTIHRQQSNYGRRLIVTVFILVVAIFMFNVNSVAHSAEPPKKNMAWLLVHNTSITRGPIRAVLVYGNDNNARDDAMLHVDPILRKKLLFVSSDISDEIRLFDWKAVKLDSDFENNLTVKITIKYRDGTFWTGFCPETIYKTFFDRIKDEANND